MKVENKRYCNSYSLFDTEMLRVGNLPLVSFCLISNFQVKYLQAIFPC